jgi:hypothetical protein
MRWTKRLEPNRANLVGLRDEHDARPTVQARIELVSETLNVVACDFRTAVGAEPQTVLTRVGCMRLANGESQVLDAQWFSYLSGNRIAVPKCQITR